MNFNRTLSKIIRILWPMRNWTGVLNFQVSNEYSQLSTHVPGFQLSVGVLYGTPYDQIFNIYKERCNLIENASTLLNTMQHGEYAPTCIRQYHLSRYRKMQVVAYLRVHVDAFLSFTSVAIEVENLWWRGNFLPCYPYKDNMASVFNGWNLGYYLERE